MIRQPLTALAACVRGAAVVAALLVLTSATFAGTILEIQLGGVDIGYDGTDIVDADPGNADPDPLTTVTFVVDGSLVGSVLIADISLDMLLPSVLDIDKSGDTVLSASGGIFNLGLPGGDYLDLNLGEATITYVDIANTVQFAFGGSVAAIDGQSLPFGLTIGDPVSISFSTQVNPGSLSSGEVNVEGFTSSGTGEIRGLVPEPTSLALLAIAGLMVGMIRRR